WAREPPTWTRQPALMPTQAGSRRRRGGDGDRPRGAKARPGSPVVSRRASFVSTPMSGGQGGATTRGKPGRLLGMRSMDSRDVDQAVAEMVRVLEPHESKDW